MDNMEVLIEKYFDGRTTCAEERAIRQAFAQGEVPEHLEVYRPLFAYLDKEAQRREHAEDVTPARRKIVMQSPHRHRYWIGSIAAGLALCLVLARFLPGSGKNENYAIIDGKRYTDPALVQAKAREALDNVSYTDEELNLLLFPQQP